MPVPRDFRLAILAAGSFIFALFLGADVAWFVFYAIAGFLALTAFWAWYAGWHVKCRAEVDRNYLMVGQCFTLRMRIENRGRWPAPWIEIQVKPGVKINTEMPAKTNCQLEQSLQVEIRGHYRVGPVRLITGDGFGLFGVVRPVKGECYITAYPRITSILPTSQRVRPAGNAIRNQRPFSSDPHRWGQIRPYRPGDSIRHMHWPLSARQGILHIREFEPAGAAHAAILLNLGTAVDTTGPAAQIAEACLEAAATLVAAAAQEECTVSLHTCGNETEQVPPSRGPKLFRRAMGVLARMQVGDQTPFSQTLRSALTCLPPAAAVKVITPELTPELAALLAGRRRRSTTLILIKPETFARPGAAISLGEREQLLYSLAGRGVTVCVLGRES